MAPSSLYQPPNIIPSASAPVKVCAEVSSSPLDPPPPTPPDGTMTGGTAGAVDPDIEAMHAGMLAMGFTPVECGVKAPQPAPNRRPDRSIDPSKGKPPPPPPPPPKKSDIVRGGAACPDRMGQLTADGVTIVSLARRRPGWYGEMHDGVKVPYTYSQGVAL